MPHNSGLIAVYELNVLEDHRTLSTIFAAVLFIVPQSSLFSMMTTKGDCISLGVNLEFFYYFLCWFSWLWQQWACVGYPGEILWCFFCIPLCITLWFKVHIHLPFHRCDPFSIIRIPFCLNDPPLSFFLHLVLKTCGSMNNTFIIVKHQKLIMGSKIMLIW